MKPNKKSKQLAISRSWESRLPHVRRLKTQNGFDILTNCSSESGGIEKANTAKVSIWNSRQYLLSKRSPRLCFAPRHTKSAIVAEMTKLFGLSLSPLVLNLKRTIAEEREIIESIQFGDTVYPLRVPVEGIYSRVSGSSGEYRVHAFTPYFTGQGETRKDAFHDWIEQVHVAFQILYRKRPFEMTEQELSQWEVLERRIDVGLYESRTPFILREIGHLVAARPDPYKIVWFDNSEDEVALAAMPAEFARFKPGQWFEALVERDRLTGRLRKVRYLHAIDPLEPMSGSEATGFWNDLPTTATLPRSDRDWTKR